jgi:hypothetical protein
LENLIIPGANIKETETVSQGTLIGIDQLILGTTTACDLHDLNGGVAIPAGTPITSELISRIKASNVVGLIAGRPDFTSHHVTTITPCLEVIASRISEMQRRSGISQALSLKTSDTGRRLLTSMFKGLQQGQLPDIDTVEVLVEDILHDTELLNSPPLPVTRPVYDSFTDLLVDDSIEMAVLIGWHMRKIGEGDEAVFASCLGALLHDAGLRLVPEFIPEKTGALNRAEQREIRRHPYLGSRMLSPLNEKIPKIARDIILMHHEREDGNGYPLMKSKDEIPQHVKLAHIIDDYIALVSQRPYRKALTPHAAIKTMMRESGRSYNRDVFKGFIKRTGLYPQGCAVILSSNEVGVVVGHEKGGPSSPVVDIYFSKHLQFSATPRRVDLGRDKLRYIQRVMK